MYVYLGMHGFMIARLWCARERKAAQNRQSDRQKGREGERKRRWANRRFGEGDLHFLQSPCAIRARSYWSIYMVCVLLCVYVWMWECLSYFVCSWDDSAKTGMQCQGIKTIATSSVHRVRTVVHNLCKCVCIYLYMICVCIMYTTYTYIYVYIYVYMYAYIYIYIYVFIFVCIYIYIHVCIYICICTACIYIYI